MKVARTETSDACPAPRHLCPVLVKKSFDTAEPASHASTYALIFLLPCNRGQSAADAEVMERGERSVVREWKLLYSRSPARGPWSVGFMCKVFDDVNTLKSASEMVSNMGVPSMIIQSDSHNTSDFPP